MDTFVALFSSLITTNSTTYTRRLTAMFAIHDAEFCPAEVLQQIKVDTTKLCSLWVNVEGEHVAST